MDGTLKCNISGLSAWGCGASNLTELKCLDRGDMLTAEAVNPKPERIPPRERRRAPLSVRLAVEVADQACQAAGRNPQTTTSVFASGMGDMDLTDYLCKTLAQPPRLLSPTRFHNSVHNAAAGYWTISTGCHRATSALCAFEHTFPAALLEAAVQCLDDAEPVLLVLHDISSPLVFEDIKPVSDHFACALMLSPATVGTEPNLNIRVSPGALAEEQCWPKLSNAPLQKLYETNPSARALPLLLAASTGAQLDYPLGHGSRLSIEVQP